MRHGCYVFFIALLSALPLVSVIAQTIKLDYDSPAILNTPAGMVLAGPQNAPCTPNVEGALHYSTKDKTLMLCDGARWKAVKTETSGTR